MENGKLQGLEWLLDGIEGSVANAFVSLENYLKDPSERYQLEHCKFSLHQVQGALQLAECRGGVLLADELQQLIDAVLDNQVTNSNDANEVLIQAALKLPAYIKQIVRTGTDQPEILIALLNDLRAVRGKSLFSESALFAPSLNALCDDEVSDTTKLPEDNDFKPLVKKLRLMYQMALLGVIRASGRDANLTYIEKVFSKLKEISRGTEQYPLWKIAQALQEGLFKNTVILSISVKQLLKSIDRELRKLEQAGVSALRQQAPESLLKNLLYYIASSQGESKYIVEVKQQFNLEASLPIGSFTDSAMLPVFDSEAVAAISTALLEELETAKELLSRYHESGTVEFSLVEQLADVIAHMYDTFSFVGQDGQLQLLQNLKLFLNQIVQTQANLQDSQLNSVAERLMNIGASIKAWHKDCSIEAITENYAQIELSAAYQTLLTEVCNSIAFVKDNISAYVGSQWDRQFLDAVSQKLTEVCGVLTMLELSRAGDVLVVVQSFIQQGILNNIEPPEWFVLEQLADTITAIESYLEVLKDSESSNAEAILVLAETGAQALSAAAGTNVFDANTAVAITETEEDLVVAENWDDDIDDEIREIFIEEATEVLATLVELMPSWSANLTDVVLLKDIRRSFHTLKGSGRMVKAERIAELAWAFEESFNQLLDGGLQASDQIVELVSAAIQLIPKLVAAYEKRSNDAGTEQIAGLIAKLATIGQGTSLHQQGSAQQSEIIPEAAADVVDDFDMPDLAGLSLSELADDIELADVAKNDNRVLHEIFSKEAQIHLQEIADLVEEANQAAPLYSVLPKSLLRTLHTLRGSATVADISTVAELVEPLEHLITDFVDFDLEANTALITVISAIQHAIAEMLPAIMLGGSIDIPETEALLAELTVINARTIQPLLKASTQTSTPRAREKLLLLMSSGLQLTLNLPSQLADWSAGIEQSPDLLGLQLEMDELTSAAEQLGVRGLETFARSLAQIFVALQDHQEAVTTGAAVEILTNAQAVLLNQLDALAANQDEINLDAQNQTLAELVEALKTPAECMSPEVVAVEDENPELESVEEENLEDGVELESVEESLAVEALTEMGEASHSSDTAADSPLDPSTILPITERTTEYVEDERDLIAPSLTPAVEPSRVVVDTDQDSDDIVDIEIVEIFMEEAQELLEVIDTAIHRWHENPASQEPAEELKRALHTFKGGARMAGLMALGEQSHQFETLIIKAQNAPMRDDELFNELGQNQDQLLVQIQLIQSGAASNDSSALLPQKNNTGKLQGASIELTENTGFAVDPGIAEEAYVPQEMVKVSAVVLDDLVNMAGESSISRGRIEQQISEFGFTLDEMDTTIARLQEQVRRLGSETDAQVAFRREQIEASTSEGFDPLEMDRYSQLQQLSRSLLESASDLKDLKNTLVLRSKDSGTLLTQQGRINTELQKSLMRSRMVPFGRMVPRLRRIVRQVSGELAKKVNLELINIEGEMDRSILERMIPALEHMLRNAVDHGIESAEQREAAGKSTVGVITISVVREGGDILIRLADDGRGLNIKTIHDKAIRQELISADIALSEMEIMQFILRPGFSTAKDVTSISGRGVGLDVVNSDIRELGGSISIRSELGIGTELQVRLPFTVSINRSLMIESGDDTYALPLSSIGGVIRMRPNELASYYQDPNKLYKYGDREYPVRYLGSLLQDGTPPRISAVEESIPLVLVHAEQQCFAVQVDRLGGSSEIVVKALGRPFSAVPGLSGATVLGDGRVVVILDLLALLRTQKSAPITQVQWLEDADAALVEAVVPTVMVVDDSVTVRKVTSRFLAREGFNILTAKDGADAMRLLRDHDPDVMLLDIEMPRMDGFEVAARLRSMARFRELPIIMITSRTGNKHREQAKSLGVNHYLGKPYREEQLLASITELLEQRKAQVDLALESA